MNGYLSSSFSKMGLSPREKLAPIPRLQPRELLQPTPLLEPTPIIGPGRTTVERGTSERSQPVERGRVDRGFSTRRTVGDSGGNYSDYSMNEGGSGRIGGPRIDINMDEQDPYEKMKKEMENVRKGQEMLAWDALKRVASDPVASRERYASFLQGQPGQNQETMKANLSEFDQWAKNFNASRGMMNQTRQGYSSPNDTRNRYT